MNLPQNCPVSGSVREGGGLTVEQADNTCPYQYFGAT